MKKVYSKPDIFYEDFALSTNIAAGCAVKVTDNNGKPGFPYDDMYIFTSVCYDPVEGDSWGGVCYQNPTDTTNVFNS